MGIALYSLLSTRYALLSALDPLLSTRSTVFSFLLVPPLLFKPKLKSKSFEIGFLTNSQKILYLLSSLNLRPVKAG